MGGPLFDWWPGQRRLKTSGCNDLLPLGIRLSMTGIGIWQLLIVLAIALLLFGGSRLPGLARSLGQSINEFKKGVKEIDDKSEESEQ